MANGTVKFFNASKGFGFITPDDGGKDVFVPTASIAASGLSSLKPGQRLTFETVPDAKGPKAVDLKVTAEPVREAPSKPPRPAPQAAEKPVLTVYLDPASDLAADAVDELQEAGYAPRLVDYIASPPSRDELKALSLLLRDGDQSLVRRYDPLFLELRLDDRFISDSEYWGAVHEHPSLINGPVLATPTRARVCRTESAVKDFMATLAGGGIAAATRPKGLPDSLRKLVTGLEPPAAPANVPQEEAVAEPKPKKAKAGDDNEKAGEKPAAKAKPKPAGKKPAKKAAPVKKAAKPKK